MIINKYVVNADTALNGDDFFDGPILYISKTIKQKATDGGVLFTISKSIVNTNVPRVLLTIEKIVSDAARPIDFFARFGFKPIVVLGGLTISDTQLHESVTVTKSEDDNHTAKFTLRLFKGTYNLYDYMGKPVTIRVLKNGAITTLFTGFVDKPVVNALLEKIVINCISDRRKLINNLAYLEPYIGYYDKTVFNDDTSDLYTRINNRLETIPSSLDFDSFNNPYLTSWTPGAPTFTWSSNGVFRRSPSINIESASNIVNNVTINMEYGYQRLHHRQVAFTWASGYSGAVCTFLEDAPTMPNRDAVRGAAEGTGWYIQPESLAFEDLLKSGNYVCDGNWVSWSTIQTQVENIPVVQNDALTGATVPVLDSSGNPIVRQSTKQIADFAKVFAVSAGWVGTKRFNQNLKESYSLTITAPASIAKYGSLPSTESYSYNTVLPYQEWEANYKSYSPPPTGFVINTLPDNGSYFINGDGDRAAFNNALVVALNKAKTTILKGHRDTTISFSRELTPGIELYHTVRLTGKWIRGSGKCQTITHVMNIGSNSDGESGSSYTSIIAATYRNTQVVADTVLVAPASVANNANVPIEMPIDIGSHYGVDPESAGSETWDGYVGNMSVTEIVPSVLGPGYPSATNVKRSSYQESFTVSVKEVSSVLRDDKTFTGAANYNVNIPTDNLVYQAYQERIGE